MATNSRTFKIYLFLLEMDRRFQFDPWIVPSRFTLLKFSAPVHIKDFSSQRDLD